MRYIKPYELLTSQIQEGTFLTADYRKDIRYVFKYRDKTRDSGRYPFLYRVWVQEDNVVSIHNTKDLGIFKTELKSSYIYTIIERGKGTNIRFSTTDEIETYNEIFKKTRLPF